jgi:hypothetical protein
MANNGTINVLLQFTKNNIATKSLAIAAAGFQTAGKDYQLATMQVPVGGAGLAIPLGPLLTSPPTVLGEILIKNNGPATDVIELLSAVSGTVLGRCSSGRCILMELPAGVTVPAMVAVSTASPPNSEVDAEYFILPV